MSFVPPHITPPDPPIAKMVLLAFSIFMSLVMIIFIGFVSIDFLTEMTGHPFYEMQFSPQDLKFPPDKDDIATFKPSFELITPKHQTQIWGSGIVVIYTRRLPDSLAMPPELMIDNVRFPWEKQYGKNTWFSRLSLPVGLHHVQVEGAEAEFFIETADSSLRSPEPWLWNHPHPGTDQMDQCCVCHVMVDMPIDPLAQGHDKAIGTWKGIESCFDCHDVNEFEYRHAAVQPANQCLRCHAVH